MFNVCLVVFLLGWAMFNVCRPNGELAWFNLHFKGANVTVTQMNCIFFFRQLSFLGPELCLNDGCLCFLTGTAQSNWPCGKHGQPRTERSEERREFIGALRPAPPPPR